MRYNLTMTQNRTVHEKASDTLRAFDELRAELTPQSMRALVDKMTSQQPDEHTDIAAYASLVNAAMVLAREVGKNDRAAMLAAAMITQSGVARPIIDTEGE